MQNAEFFVSRKICCLCLSLGRESRNGTLPKFQHKKSTNHFFLEVIYWKKFHSIVTQFGYLFVMVDVVLTQQRRGSGGASFANVE